VRHHRLLQAFAILAAFMPSALVNSQSAPPSERTPDQVMPLVNSYCGACHAVPRPDVLAKRHWPAVIRNMVGIMQRRSGRAHITEQGMQDIIALYYGSAPEELPALPILEEKDSDRKFVRRDLGALSALPTITHVNVANLTRAKTPDLLVCDAEARKLLLMRSVRGTWREQLVGDMEVPVHTQVVDIDGDGDSDILAADLGQFPPLDAPVGKVWIFRQGPAGKFTRELVIDQLGRVSDARALDLDGDGDLDIAVAVFGGGDVGEVFWLENQGRGFTAKTLRKHALMQLSGAITVSPADLDGDGKVDLTVLVAQEHERVVAFVNRGAGEFELQVITRGPHPMYGSTSLTTVDLDRDGDVDVLFTNGDAFDAQTDPKPYHGVQWLENKGGLQFEFHDIGRFYGAATAQAGDIDGDGDLDVVAGSWVNYWTEPGRHALVWYENDGKQVFTAHGIATRPAGIASLQLVDVDGDGALDIVAGAIRMDLMLAKAGSEYRAGRLFPPADGSPTLPRVILFENHRRR
jgi:hypothetical protein